MINLIYGDCLEKMKEIPDQSVDMILTDPPYGTTDCKWDVVIPFEPMWKELKRVIKPGGAICFFCAEIFTAQLVLSNKEMYRYTIIWEKSRAGRFAQAKLRFLNTHEDIAIFSDGKCSSNSILKMRYFPQGLQPLMKMMPDRSFANGLRKNRKPLPDYFQEFTGYPKSVLKFSSVSKTSHPTQKPVALLEYLIKTYTLENETVLDFTAGSFSTGVAAVNLGRGFIGIEKDEHYYNIGVKRVREAIDAKIQK